MKRKSGGTFLRAIMLIMLAAVVTPAAVAQSTTDGAIGGTVTDQSGAVVPSAKVTAQNLGTASVATAVTDDNGRYLISHLQPGVYSVEVAVPDFALYKVARVTVEVGRATVIDARLSVKAATETVVATAEAPVIVADRADFSTNINQTTIENLPINGRRWSFFALSTPGAVPDGGFGLVSFRGISGLLNNNTVDGADNTQAFFSEERGRTRISYSSSEASIQEFQINTSNYSAEYGRAAGGVVNAVTKSGTNQVHGEAFWYDRNSDWGAINPFQTHRVNGVSVPFLPEDKRHQFGGGIGGPIIKDKLFWFLSADQQLRPFPAVANSGVPGAVFAPLSASEASTLTGRGISPTSTEVTQALTLLTNLTGTVPRRGDQLILLPKIDWNVNSKNHASFTYNRLRWNSPEGIQTAAVVNRGIESFGNDYVKDDWGVAKLITTVTPTITNELRYQYGRDFEFENGQNPIAGEPISSLGSSPQIQLNDSATGGFASFVFGMPNFLNRPQFPDERRNQVADTVAWSHGTHLFKFGFDVNHVHDLEVNLFEGFGAYQYNTRADFITDFVAARRAAESNTQTITPLCTATVGTPPVAIPAACYSSFAQGFGTPGFEFTTNDLAFFAQDDWRIRPRLTVNLGLRYETEIMPSPQIPNSALPTTATFPSDRSDVGPRVGFAWDLKGNGQTVVRGGYGIFYGRIINSTIFNAIANTALPASQSTVSLTATSATAPQYPNVIASGGGTVPFGATAVGFAPDTKLPLVHEFDAELERQIAINTVVSVSYVGSLGRRLPRFVDTNLVAPTLQNTFAVLQGTGTVTSPFAGQDFVGQTFNVPYFGVPADATGKKPASGGTGRPNIGFGSITNISDGVDSKYNALVISVNRRFYKGFQIQSSYTYSHSTDFGQSSQTFTASNNVLNPFDLNAEQGRSNFDIRHRFAFGAVWTPDAYKGENRILQHLANGYTLSPLVSVSSGAPFTPAISGNAPNLPGFLAFTGGTGILDDGGTNRVPWLAPNSFQMPRTANVDFRLQKQFAIWESWKLTLSGDAFNLFNHNNVTAVNTTMFTICAAGANCTPLGAKPAANSLVFNPKFGVPTQSSNTLIAQRQIQVGIKLDF
ncbi:MAG TPA: TonB-dependent receptor [Candidatus Methylomirabilis sp.]|nr:TonB-dependent receptor [Candidatus Methylomirabilis sp.]